jgi:hypothetical protein
VQTGRVTAALSPRLAAIREQLGAATAVLHRIADPLDDATWRRRPAPGRWSVAECVEPLNLTSRALIPLLRDAARDARARGLTKPSQRMDLVGWFLVRSLEPPARARFRTTEAFAPPSIRPKEAVIREWHVLQDGLAALLDELDGLTLTKVRITSPFNVRVRYNAGSALRIAAAHQRRHLWQAQRVLDEIAVETSAADRAT